MYPHRSTDRKEFVTMGATLVTGLARHKVGPCDVDVSYFGQEHRIKERPVGEEFCTPGVGTHGKEDDLFSLPINSEIKGRCRVTKGRRSNEESKSEALGRMRETLLSWPVLRDPRAVLLNGLGGDN
ncbi:hypothetical protein RRG08_036334 [Elysia crispata]|uniref:Uncharacterized protein n=1 Tax=Elysia crispata TaxID=231223 RepID=A0AAE0ZQ65_9GAST|nr:hypothetical protein RRG08_036334 [Elysia crispata]